MAAPRKLLLGVLHALVALLVAAPPILVKLLVDPCDGAASCAPLTSRELFTGDIARLWLPPLVIALVLLGVLFRLRGRGAPTTR